MLTTESLVALLTLTALEIVLGVDNVIFIAVLSGRLPEGERARARSLGIGLAVLSRIVLLLSISWVMRLTQPLLVLPIIDRALSGRDLILLVGGAFLIAKSTKEIHHKLEERDAHLAGVAPRASTATLAGVLGQIMLIDVVFSLDSVITAIGIADDLWVMVVAIVVAAVIMVVFAGRISRFVEHHPTMKILALAFLILIGTLLVIEGWDAERAHDMHLKNYAYFAMAFSFVVELVNMRFRPSFDPVRLRGTPHPPADV